VPFYANRLGNLPHVPPGQLTYEQFRTLPLMTRTDIQDAGHALVSRDVPKTHGPMHVIRSSGSTGRPVEARGTQFTQTMLMALTMRGHLWHRRDLAQKNIDIRTALPPGTPPPTRWAPIPRTGTTLRLDIAQPVSALLQQVLAEEPAYLQTHPHTIKGMVQHSLEIGRRPRHLREVRTFGEAVPPDLRGYVKAHWGVPMIDNYSANEVGTIAHQCPTTTNMHVQGESILVEILRDDDEPCAPGEIGRVVLTALHNFATPLIRYEIGDRAKLGEPCSCGRGLPVLERIIGRERNLLAYPNGDRMFPETRIGLVEAVAPFRQFQLIQPEANRLVFNVVPSRPWTKEDEQVLRDFLIKKFRHPFEIEIAYHDDIPRAANGKFEEFRSDVT
jgi:phenylacetate-CoA ligase